MDRKHSDKMLFRINRRTKYQKQINHLSLDCLKDLTRTSAFISYVNIYEFIKKGQDKKILFKRIEIEKRIMYLETTELILGVNDA